MQETSLRKVALCCREKLSNIAYSKVCPIDRIDALITRLPSDDARPDTYRRFKVDYITHIN